MDIENFYYEYIRQHKYYRSIIYRDLIVLYNLYCDRILYADNSTDYYEILKVRVHLKWDSKRIVSLNLTGLLQGYIPEYIDQLLELKYLFIEHCNLHSIPSVLEHMPSLYHLYLDNNPIQFCINQYIDTALHEGKYPSLYLLSTDQTLIYLM